MKMFPYILLLVLLSAPAFSREDRYTNGYCYFSVFGKQYINGSCKIMIHDFESDVHDIFFKGKKYFGYINQNEDGSFEGLWNGSDAETHAQAPLGSLQHKRHCWFNKDARICILSKNTKE